MAAPDETVLHPSRTQALDEFSTWWDETARAQDKAESKDQPLFHYTNAGGLTGIIAAQEVWFTSVYHLNDPGELAYGIEFAVEALREHSGHGDAAVKLFCDTMEHVLVHRVGDRFGFYVASFSREGNDLGQWRAYGDDGRGYALGLSPKLIYATPPDSAALNEKIFVATVSYSKRDLEAKQRDAIGRAVSLVAREQGVGFLSQREGAHFFRDLSSLLALPLLWNSLATKHEAYRHERETRLFLVNGADELHKFVKTRVRGSTIVPYIPCPMKVKQDGAIDRIVVGPSANDEAEFGLKSFLRAQGIPTTNVEPSGIPYRSS